jgi:acyl-[acyl-carrier-protein]-phospholipid O-acyltransferase/long-chain-fatty-acid--[acyl-carrier-protein] ligase
MKELFKIGGFTPYIFIVFLNAMTDLGHKIILQNTIFKAYEGSELIILTAIINALILLPFIFLFSPAGFLSDKYPKVQIIRVASLLAILITSLILLSYIMGWFWFAFGMTFLLAAQSAIYAPAKYGLIKEMVGNEKLTEANAMVQSITIISILAGAVIYSIFFESLLSNQILDKAHILQTIYPLGFALIGASILEFLLSLHLIKKVDIKSGMRFKAKRYVNLTYLRGNLRVIKRNQTVWLSIIGLSIFWGISQLVVAIFGEYLKENMGVTNTVIAQGLLSISGLGIVAGSLSVGRVSRRYIETGIIPIGALGIAISLFFISSLESLVGLGVLFFFYGFFSGLFIVPLNTLIQFATPKKMMGKVLAGSNFMQNLSMFIFLMLSALFAFVGFSSKGLFTLAMLIAFGGFLYTLIKLPQSMVRFAVRVVFGLRYRVSVEGLDNFKSSRGVLLLGNHISFLDWAFLQIAYPKQIRFVIDRNYYNIWYFKPIFKFFKAIPISTRGGKKALSLITEELNNGHTVALFPEGNLSRNGHLGKFYRGFEYALSSANRSTIIVPFYLRGLWEGEFSHASKKMRSKRLKDIGITFGKPMSIKSSAIEVKEEVFKLSILSWNSYAKRLPTIQEAWIRGAKETGSNLAIADSTGVELNGHRFITAVLLMRDAFKKLLKDNQNIGLLVPTSAGGSIANMATLTLGKTIVNLNYSSGTESLKHAIELADIKNIITSKQFITKLKAKGFNLDEVLDGRDVIYLEDLKAKMGKFKQLRTYLIAKFLPIKLLTLCFIKDVKTSDTAVIMFSSGSEGTPKGIELSHINMMGNIKQIASLLNPTEQDVMLGTLPIFHSFGLTVTTLLPLIEGIPVVCHPDPTDGYGIAKLSVKYRATILFATATFYRLYARNRKIHPLMFDTLKMVVAGAEKLPKDIVELFKKRFGKSILEGYGTTETTPVASCNLHDTIDPDDYHVQIANREGSIGLPILGTSFMIVDPDTFEPLPIGEEGMMLIGGTQVMKGYLKDEEKTKSVIREIDGIRWYITGDKGRIDEDGFVTIVDRYSRFAKIGGEMISLGAVEQEITKILDEDTQIAITAIPSIKRGEEIVLLLEGERDIDELKREIKNIKLNPLYRPTKYFKVDTLPKLGSGKADFKGLKKMALSLV